MAKVSEIRHVGYAVTHLEQVGDANWEAKVHSFASMVMDQRGIGIGRPQTMPHRAPDPGLFQPAGV